MQKNIPFNVPFLTGKETEFFEQAIQKRKLSGNGEFTQRCQDWFQSQLGTNKTLLTTSCTDALELSALLINIEPGDEVIIPSYTFVSTANPFILRGAKVKFIDSRKDHPGIDEEAIEQLVTKKTKAIIPVHYAGVACDMGKILGIAKKHNLKVVEDAAQAVDSYYKGKPLGTLGQLGTFSFHETKNISCGEGGLLIVNNPDLATRSEILWEKGTNRAAFWRGEVDKYGWVDVGSSYLPSELTATVLWAQLERLKDIQKRRVEIYNIYFDSLSSLIEKGVQLPFIPQYATCNGHMFYLVCRSAEERSSLIAHLKSKEINAVFHYLSLHSSPFFKDKHDGRPLPYSDIYTDCLVRLPLYYTLTEEDQNLVIDEVLKFFAEWS